MAGDAWPDNLSSRLEGNPCDRCWCRLGGGRYGMHGLCNRPMSVTPQSQMNYMSMFMYTCSKQAVSLFELPHGMQGNPGRVPLGCSGMHALQNTVVNSASVDGLRCHSRRCTVEHRCKQSLIIMVMHVYNHHAKRTDGLRMYMYVRIRCQILCVISPQQHPLDIHQTR